MKFEQLFKQAELNLMNWIDTHLDPADEFDGTVCITRRRVQGETRFEAYCMIERMVHSETHSELEMYELANSSSEECETRKEALELLCQNFHDFTLLTYRLTQANHFTHRGRGI